MHAHAHEPESNLFEDNFPPAARHNTGQTTQMKRLQQQATPEA
jgi:hypothetical protein